MLLSSFFFLSFELEAQEYKQIQNRWKTDQYLHNQHGKIEVGQIGAPGWSSVQWKRKIKPVPTPNIPKPNPSLNIVKGKPTIQSSGDRWVKILFYKTVILFVCEAVLVLVLGSLMQNVVPLLGVDSRVKVPSW